MTEGAAGAGWKDDKGGGGVDGGGGGGGGGMVTQRAAGVHHCALEVAMADARVTLPVAVAKP